MSTPKTTNNKRSDSESNISLSELLPDPQVLKEYEAIGSGAILDWWKGLLEREIEQYERECCRNHELKLEEVNLEKQRLQLQAAEVKRGQIFGLIIGVVAILSGSITSIQGAPIPGGLIGAGGVIGLVAVFVFGRKMKKGQKQD